VRGGLKSPLGRIRVMRGEEAEVPAGGRFRRQRCPPLGGWPEPWRRGLRSNAGYV